MYSQQLFKKIECKNYSNNSKERRKERTKEWNANERNRKYNEMVDLNQTIILNVNCLKKILMKTAEINRVR